MSLTDKQVALLATLEETAKAYMETLRGANVEVKEAATGEYEPQGLEGRAILIVSSLLVDLKELNSIQEDLLQAKQPEEFSEIGPSHEGSPS